MSNRIDTFEKLLEEKKRLQTLIKAQKELIRYDVVALKAELTPVGVAFGFLKNLTSRDKKAKFLNFGVDMLVDIVIKRIFLAKAGWITKLTVPFLVRNFSSNVLHDNNDTIIGRLKSWLRRRKNGNVKHQES